MNEDKRDATSSSGAGGDDDAQTKTIGEMARENQAAADGVSDLTERLVRKLAKDEIRKWRETAPRLFHPKTWAKSTQANTFWGSVFAIFAVVLGYFNLDTLSTHLHSIVDTEGRVTVALKNLSQEAATSENPLFQLVGETMRQAPVLAFHGEHTFGRSFEVELPDRECQKRRREEAENLSSTDFAGLPLPDGAVGLAEVKDLCAIRGLIDFGLDLDIPFHARFFENANGAAPHRVWLVAFIRRTSDTDDSSVADIQDANGRPPGLCFIYKPASPAAGIEGLPITDFERTGNGLWIADLTERLNTAGVWKDTPANPNATTALHSVIIEGVMAGTAASDDCTDFTPAKDQIISVSAMILVNKNAYE